MTRAVTVAAVVLAVVTGAFGVVQAGRASDEADRAGRAEARAEAAEAVGDEDLAIRAAAEAFTTALLTYEAGALDDARTRLAEVATDAFLDTWGEALGDGVGAAIDEVGASASATVREVFTGAVDDDRVGVVVVVDMEVRSSRGVRTLTGVVLRLDLRRDQVGWRVDELTTVAAEDVELAPS